MSVKRGSHFDIYIPRLSVRGRHILSILTKYLALQALQLVSANSSDPDNCSILCNHYEDVDYHITFEGVSISIVIGLVQSTRSPTGVIIFFTEPCVEVANFYWRPTIQYARV